MLRSLGTRGKEKKHRNTQSRGWSCCLKVTSQLHWVHAWLPGSLQPQEQWVRFPPQTSFSLSPHSFKAQTYLQFQTTSFCVPRIRHWKASPLCCTRKVWMSIRHLALNMDIPQPHLQSWRKQRTLSKPINQLPFFLRLLSCRRIDKWQWLQPNL